MKRVLSLRSTLIALTIAAAALPALLIGYPLVGYIKWTTQKNATNELRLAADDIAGKLARDLDLIIAAARSTAADGDVQRSLSSLVFVGRADRLLTGLLDKYPLIESARVYARDAALVTAAPATAVVEPLPENTIDLVKLKLAETKGKLEVDATSERLAVLAPIEGLMGETAGLIVVTVRREELTKKAKTSVADDASVTVDLTGVGGVTRQGDMSARAVIDLQDGSSSDSEGSLYMVYLTEPEETRMAPVRSFSRWLSFVVALAVVLFGAASFYVARRVLAPVTALDAHVRRVAVGDYDAPVPEVPFTELSTFATTLGDLGRAVKAQLAALTEKERARAELERAQIQAELDAMRSQMNPHFLFNSLNSVSTMAGIDPARAQTMISRLADLYRAILESSKTPTAALEHELAIVTNYLELERMRFGKRLTFDVVSDPSIASVQVPGLVLQTLVENAVKHGVAPEREGGYVRVEARPRPGGGCTLQVSNSGRRLGSGRPASGTRTGLANTRRRLDLLYGSAHGFRLYTREDGATVAEFGCTGAPA